MLYIITAQAQIYIMFYIRMFMLSTEIRKGKEISSNPRSKQTLTLRGSPSPAAARGISSLRARLPPPLRPPRRLGPPAGTLDEPRARRTRRAESTRRGPATTEHEERNDLRVLALKLTGVGEVETLNLSFQIWASPTTTVKRGMSPLAHDHHLLLRG
ncbi:unnamed protein product [Urochloa humidicola]